VSGAKPALSTLKAGSKPGSLAVVVSGSPGVHRLVVTNTGSNTVSIVNLTSSATRAPAGAGSIGVCKAPSGAAVDQAANILYIACSDSSVQAVDLAARSVVQTYAGATGRSIAVATALKKAFIADATGLRVIDLASKKVIATTITSHPVGVAVGAAGDRVYVTEYGSREKGGALLIVGDDLAAPASKILSNSLQPVPSQTFRVGPPTLTGEGVVPPNTFPFAGRSTDVLSGVKSVAVTFVGSANGARFSYDASVINCDDGNHECTWVVHKGPPPPGAYRVTARATDGAGNVESPGASATVIVAAVATRASNAAGVWGLLGGLAAAGIAGGVLTTRRRRRAA
ncbi:MAG: hypothetical protein ABR548_11715, partial [Actinomycetota bacterium]